MLSGGSDGKESSCNCRRPRFNPWVGKIPWNREWQLPPVFLPGEFHGQGSLEGYRPWCLKSQTWLSDWHYYVPIAGWPMEIHEVFFGFFPLSVSSIHQCQSLSTCFHNISSFLPIHCFSLDPWYQPPVAFLTPLPSCSSSPSSLKVYFAQITTWTELYPNPSIPMLKSWPPVPLNVTIFGDKAFKEMIKLKWGHWGRP